MKLMLVRFGTAAMAAVAMALAGCGGGGGGGDAAPVPPPPVTAVSVQQALAQAAAVATNDTSVNAAAPFTVLQGTGVMPAVSVVGTTTVARFAVFSDGKVKSDLALSNVSFAIAKLVPGTNGDPDKWVNYIYRTETATPTVGPNGKAALISALQATTDTKGTDPAQLAYNADGYYTYKFTSDITKNASGTAAYEPSRTHRVAIQLSYKDAAGKTILVNPYFDFTIDASGNSVAVDPSQTRKMTDVGSCNTCHDKLALHGGGRVDTQYCVMCHNSGTTDANSGNVLTLSTMAHKIHSGKDLAAKGENYTIWGYRDTKIDFSEVGFPQPTRNCVKCHDGSNPLTPQGDNWKTKPSKEACLTCHQSGSTSAWYATHVTTLKIGTSDATTPNSTCASCHGAGSPFSPDKVHWVQEMANAALYQGVVESVKLSKAPTATTPGTLSVTYAVINPANGAAYDLREGCSATATTDTAGNSIPGCNTNYRWDAVLPPALPGALPNKFGTFSLNAGANTLAPTTDDATATTSYAAYRGVDNGSHHYTAALSIPAGTHGNVRVVITGAAVEQRLDPATRAPIGATPPTANSDVAYVPVKNAVYEFDVDTKARSTTTARRQLVSNDNCNTCHGILGLPTGAGEEPGFHKGVRNNSEICSVCHNANQAGGYTLMTDGSTGPVAGDSQLPAGNTSSFLHESYQAKRFVHGIHGGQKRAYAFTHCMNVGGEYTKQADGTWKSAGGVTMGKDSCINNQYPGVTDNFTAEVAYPGQLAACSNCHVKDSWKQDKSVLGSVVFKQTGVTDMLNWQVISPKAATCTSCHDSKSVQTHVKTVGATFGTLTQGDVLNGAVFESCEGCHAAGSAIGVDTVHGLK